MSPSELTVGIAEAASGTSVTALLNVDEVAYETSWRVYARSMVKAIVSYSPCGSAAADRSVLPSIFRVPPITGVPAATLADNHETVEGLKFVGLKRSLPVEADGDVPALLLPHAATAIAAMPTTPSRLVMPKGVVPVPRPNRVRTVIGTSL